MKSTITAAMTATLVETSRARKGRPMSRVAAAIRGAGGMRPLARVSRSWPTTTRAGLIATSSPQVEGARPYEATAITGSTVSKPQ